GEPGEEIPETTRAGLQESVAGERFIVMVMKLDGFAVWKRALTTAEQGCVRLRVAHLAAEELGHFHPCDAVVMEEDEIDVLVRGGIEMDRLLLALAELNRECQARHRLSFTIGVGDPAYSLSEIPRSASAAAERCRYRLFKLVAGQSFGDYLNSVRLEKARELLAGTNESAQAIGESVGIYNATYFSTLFKKAYGLSPSRYRNRSLAS
ncbi:MAG TPA: helix-turn-helix transcriptional regulator, partial [Spirochaetia bacterium]